MDDPEAVQQRIEQAGGEWLMGEPDIKGKLLTGHNAGAKTFKVHLDGYNQLPYLTGQQDKSARPYFIYFNDDADLVAMRFANWKIVFEEQRAPGTLLLWLSAGRSVPSERASLS